MKNFYCIVHNTNKKKAIKYNIGIDTCIAYMCPECIKNDKISSEISSYLNKITDVFPEKYKEDLENSTIQIYQIDDDSPHELKSYCTFRFIDNVLFKIRIYEYIKSFYQNIIGIKVCISSRNNVSYIDLPSQDIFPIHIALDDKIILNNFKKNKLKKNKEIE